MKELKQLVEDLKVLCEKYGTIDAISVYADRNGDISDISIYFDNFSDGIDILELTPDGIDEKTINA